VTNAVKHGQAKSVRIGLASRPGQIILTLRNDGAPFPKLTEPATGLGLRIMNYRASLIGASLEIKRDSPAGACVICAVPLPAAESRPPPPGTPAA